jgi:hypothetical protein
MTTMLRAFRTLALCGGFAACAAPTPAPSAQKPVDWGWPSAAAADGKSRLQLQTVLRNGPWTPGGNDTWQIQGEVETDDPGALLSDMHAKIRVTPDDGAESAFDREHSMLDAAHRSVVLHGLDLGPDARRIATLEIELRLVRVKTWTTGTGSVAGPGATSRVIVAPFEFALTGEANWVTVSAYSTDESMRDRRDVFDLVSHRWSSGAADVVDARGTRLDATGGGGSGGFTSCMYRSMTRMDAQIAYPVAAKLRVPDTWDVETVRYRFADLDLASVPPPR